MTQLYSVNGNGSLIMTAYPGGFDGGNEDSCFACIDRDGRERVIVIPSAVAEVTDNRLDLLRSAVNGSEQSPTVEEYQQNIDVRYRGKRYTVGYGTYRQKKEATPQRGDEKRYSSLEQILRLLTTSGLVISDPEYALELIITVPVKFFSNKLRLEVKQAFEGEHEFILNGVGRKTTIHVRKVMIEGPSALALYGAGSSKSRRLIIDGGRHTTELLTLDGREPIADLCKGIEVGVQLIADHLYNTLAEQHNRRLTSREISDIIRAYGSRNQGQPLDYPEIACGMSIISSAQLSSIVREGAQLLANEILNEAGSLWGNTNNVVAGDIIHQFFVGGAALFIAEEMSVKMPRLSPVVEPEKANARGSAMVARALMLKQ